MIKTLFIKEKNTYSCLILLILVSFGFFGSLSHVFSVSLIFLILTNRFTEIERPKIDFNSKLLFFSLSGIFFLFLLLSFFRDNFMASLSSMSTLLPIPLIGILILFSKNDDIEFNSSQLSLFAQISVIVAFVIYILLRLFFGEGSLFYQYHSGRLKLFSGNPIPFSFVMLGLSLFCLAGWKNSKTVSKVRVIFCVLIGIYFSSFLSGARGTLFSFLLVTPLIIFYISKTRVNALIFTMIAVICILMVAFLHINNIIHSVYFNHIEKGIETLFSSKQSEFSIALRLEMWSASIKTIAEAPFLGFSITERFNAISPYLPENFSRKFSHPHNDIFASIISAGFLGGIMAFFALVTPVLAGLLDIQNQSERLYFGAMFTIVSLVTANFSTVLFNDISSAWLTFSTYLIWKTKF